MKPLDPARCVMASIHPAKKPARQASRGGHPRNVFRLKLPLRAGIRNGHRCHLLEGKSMTPVQGGSCEVVQVTGRLGLAAAKLRKPGSNRRVCILVPRGQRARQSPLKETRSGEWPTMEGCVVGRISSHFMHRDLHILRVWLMGGQRVWPGDRGFVVEGDSAWPLDGGEIEISRVDGDTFLASTGLQQLGANRWVCMVARPRPRPTRDDVDPELCALGRIVKQTRHPSHAPRPELTMRVAPLTGLKQGDMGYILEGETMRPLPGGSIKAKSPWRGLVTVLSPLNKLGSNHRVCFLVDRRQVPALDPADCVVGRIVKRFHLARGNFLHLRVPRRASKDISSIGCVLEGKSMVPFPGGRVKVINSSPGSVAVKSPADVGGHQRVCLRKRGAGGRFSCGHPRPELPPRVDDCVLGRVSGRYADDQKNLSIRAGRRAGVRVGDTGVLIKRGTATPRRGSVFKVTNVSEDSCTAVTTRGRLGRSRWACINWPAAKP